MMPPTIMRNLIRFVATLFLSLSLGIGSVATAGELSRREIRRSTEWEPDSCYKPSQPSFYVHDLDSYNWAVDEFNAYIREVESYFQCIEDEAQGDFTILKRILEDSLDQLRSEAASDVESARSDLEISRMLLE